MMAMQFYMVEIFLWLHRDFAHQTPLCIFEILALIIALSKQAPSYGYLIARLLLSTG